MFGFRSRSSVSRASRDHHDLVLNIKGTHFYLDEPDNNRRDLRQIL